MTLSIKRLQKIVDFLPGYGWAASPSGHNMIVSRELRGLIGGHDVMASPTEPSEFIWEPLLLPDEYRRVAERWREAVSTSSDYQAEHQLLCWDGTYRWIKTSGKPVKDRQGNILYWLGVVVDIDELVRAVEAAQLNEQRLQAHLDAIPAPLWVTDERGWALYVNRSHISEPDLGLGAYKSWAGDPLAFLPSKTHPDHAAMVDCCLRESYSTGKPLNVQYLRRVSNGTYRWYNSRAEPVRDEAGDVVRWYGICFDIHDEVQLREELEKQRLQLERVVETLPAMIWTADREGQPSYFNRRLKEWSGVTVEQFAHSMSGSPFNTSSTFLMHPDDREETMGSLEAAFASGGEWRHRFRQRRADGSFGWLEGRMSPLKSDTGEILHWYGLSWEITEEVQAKVELHRAQDRLNRIGQVASLAEVSAAIAHELSQPLATIVTSAAACRQWMDAAVPNLERARASTDRVVANARSANDILIRIRNLFRTSISNTTTCSLNDIAQRAIAFISETVSAKNIRIAQNLASDLPDIEADAVELQQVVLNLLRNALDAMEAIDAEDRLIIVSTEANGCQVSLSVEDRGMGVSNFEEIFEPFVTTKENGLGIGLSVSRTIVTKHFGRLWGRNCDGGAVFGFTIPMAKGMNNRPDRRP